MLTWFVHVCLFFNVAVLGFMHLLLFFFLGLLFITHVLSVEVFVVFVWDLDIVESDV